MDCPTECCLKDFFFEAAKYVVASTAAPAPIALASPFQFPPVTAYLQQPLNSVPDYSCGENCPRSCFPLCNSECCNRFTNAQDDPIKLINSALSSNIGKNEVAPVYQPVETEKETTQAPFSSATQQPFQTVLYDSSFDPIQTLNAENSIPAQEIQIPISVEICPPSCSVECSPDCPKRCCLAFDATTQKPFTSEEAQRDYCAPDCRSECTPNCLYNLCCED